MKQICFYFSLGNSAIINLYLVTQKVKLGKKVRAGGGVELSFKKRNKSNRKKTYGYQRGKVGEG